MRTECVCVFERQRMECCVHYQEGSCELNHCALITATSMCKVAAVNFGTRLQPLDYHMSARTHTHTTTHNKCGSDKLWTVAFKFMKQLLFLVVLNSYQFLSRALFVAFVIVVPLTIQNREPIELACSVMGQMKSPWLYWPCCDSMYWKCLGLWGHEVMSEITLLSLKPCCSVFLPHFLTISSLSLSSSSWDVLSQFYGPREPCADGTCCATMSLQDGGCTYASSANMATASGSMRRRLEDQEFTLRVYPGTLAEGTIYCPVTARKNTTAAEAIECLIERLRLERTKCYVLAEVKEFGGEEWILNPGDCPVQRMMLWPRSALENRSGLGSGDDYRFLLREKNLDGSIHYGGSLQMWLQVTEERRRMVERGFLPQPAGSDPPSDLCALPELTERALLESLRARFRQEKIYTYVGSILIVINPFQFLPIYNPKYVKLYDNHTLGKLEPHIYAVADVAYHAMLQRRKNQCIVISGESGSGKTQSTNFLIHHLTALSQKGFASGVEQIILGAGPVLEVRT